MLINFPRFNTNLCLLLALFLVAGCESKKPKKEITILEMHLEVNDDGAGDNKSISVFRGEHPINLNVSKEPFLDSTDLASATVVNDMGGFKLQLKFNWRGTQILSGMTAANRGKRFGVYCIFGKEKRWLAAPLENKIITDGVFTFTPDASREECEKIAKGLNELVAEIKKNEF